ncbi:MAG: redoxin domain-containing protein [Bacteroides sp.]|nr:redoxin domain-containing protein [Bacteroides sp.]MBD5332086.1 redoxin domain-containing protein [Bacteroides sp.]MBD5374889.1 redoxin domain-containing protein [Bacteroides sp.]MDE7459818.1 peroxiredoxin family protein [Paramuribaculum sp.]
MKKTISVIVLFAVLVISVSAYSGRVYEAAEGYKAPLFKVEKSDTLVSLADLRGRYVLVNFWASTDAQSRLRANDYDALGDYYPGERFCHLSVNFDRSERLFREIVRRDNLSAKSQFHVSDGEAARLSGAYHLSEGLNSFLIDPEGKIIEVNPDVRYLKSILSDV